MGNRAAEELDRSSAQEFVAGFCDGFGFSGLFAKLEQAELPLDDALEETCAANHAGMTDMELAGVVGSLAAWERRIANQSRRNKVTLMPVLEDILDATK